MNASLKKSVLVAHRRLLCAWFVANVLSCGSAVERRQDSAVAAQDAHRDVDTPSDGDSSSVRGACRLPFAIPGAPIWEPLVAHDSLAGWTPLPGGTWTIRDGVIEGTSSAAESRHGLLVSDRSFGDFTLCVVFRISQGNSGFYFRSELSGDAFGMHGIQVEMDGTTMTGGLYETGGRGWISQTGYGETPDSMLYRTAHWNEMILRADGARIEVFLNGAALVAVPADTGRRAGKFGLQLHGGEDMRVEFARIDVLSGT